MVTGFIAMLPCATIACILEYSKLSDVGHYSKPNDCTVTTMFLNSVPKIDRAYIEGQGETIVIHCRISTTPRVSLNRSSELGFWWKRSYEGTPACSDTGRDKRRGRLKLTVKHSLSFSMTTLAPRKQLALSSGFLVHDGGLALGTAVFEQVHNVYSSPFESHANYRSSMAICRIGFCAEQAYG